MKVQRGSAPVASATQSGSRVGGVHWLLVFALLLAAAFIEVWESTAVSQLSLEIDRLQVQVRDSQARTSYLDARASESSSRVRLASYARALHMRPADPTQVVVIPRDYLASTPRAGVPEDGLAAVTRRAAELFVPAARARGRSDSTD
jgi:cell division protein FtsL